MFIKIEKGFTIKRFAVLLLSVNLFLGFPQRAVVGVIFVAQYFADL
jgi:hypothetical protein